MIQQSIVILNRNGLDAKSAAQLVQVSCRYRSQILIEQGSKIINAKSLMGILSLGVGANDNVVLAVNGPDEKDAFKALSTLLKAGFPDQGKGAK